MTTHYTAHLVINATENIAQTKDRYDKVTTPVSRTVTEAASITVRAETMEALQTKLTTHVALLNEN